MWKDTSFPFFVVPTGRPTVTHLLIHVEYAIRYIHVILNLDPIKASSMVESQTRRMWEGQLLNGLLLKADVEVYATEG